MSRSDLQQEERLAAQVDLEQAWLAELQDLPLEEEVEQRFFTCQEIRLLAELSGLKVARMYGDMAETCVLGTEEDEEFRMVAVLKRTDD